MIMKQNIKQLKLTMNGKRMAGSMLLEVVLAIAVFAFGMLALVQLQGNLTRSSADANTRTVATNIAEEIVEDIRGFENRDVIAGNGEWEYLELVDTALTDTIGTVTRGGVEYIVTGEITDFWRDGVKDTFISAEATDPPVAPVGATGGAAFAAFKLLKIEVAWNTVGDTDREFFVDDENTADLGSNNITVYEVIPSSPPILGAKIAADPNAPAGGPAVDYIPGLKPDSAALDLGDGEKLKESTTPIPDVIRSGELTETYFEVVTYNTANIFVRREEFLTVGCECTLETNPGAGEGGIRPALWDGIEYRAGEFAAKPFGESANSQQSVFCDVCCRDHHDGDGLKNDAGIEDQALVYDPWAASITPGANHDHYTRSKKGDITVAGDGDVYLEACRMIRKDGFFVLAQDFNQRGFYGIANDYMDNQVELDEYSAYVTAAVTEFYTGSPPQDSLPPPGAGLTPGFTDPATGAKGPDIPASTVATATSLPTVLSSDSQQLRARGIYPDYMTNVVKDRIAACEADASATDCVLPNYTTALEIYPYIEVQVTSLTNWIEDPLYEPVDVTNERITSNNAHSRGRADLTKVGMGPTKSDFGIHKGNVGIAGTDPIRTSDPQAADQKLDFVYINTLDSGIPPVVGFEITGEILSGVGGVRATDVELVFNEAQCGRTPTGYRCVVPSLAINPTLTVNNYYKANRMLYGCSEGAGDLGTGTYVHGADNSTTFGLPSANLPTANIVIEDSPCN
jgi:hypothetical protein